MKIPCNNCGHRVYCEQSGDTCQQFRTYLNTGRVRKTCSQAPDGVGIDDKRINAERERVGLLG